MNTKYITIILALLYAVPSFAVLTGGMDIGGTICEDVTTCVPVPSCKITENRKQTIAVTSVIAGDGGNGGRGGKITITAKSNSYLNGKGIITINNGGAEGVKGFQPAGGKINGNIAANGTNGNKGIIKYKISEKHFIPIYDPNSSIDICMLNEKLLKRIFKELSIFGDDVTDCSNISKDIISKVETLDLNNLGLSEVPIKLISQMTSLKSIDFSYNNISLKQLKELLGPHILKNLTSLNIANNNLRSKLSRTKNFKISSLNTLEELNLSGNGLIIKDIYSIVTDNSNIERLDLSRNDFEHFIKDNLKQLTFNNLKYLNIGHSRISTQNLNILIKKWNMSELKEIRLYSNPLWGDEAIDFSRLNKLSNIDFSHNQYFEPLLNSVLSSMIKTLILDNTPVSEDHFDIFISSKKFMFLEKLVLGNFQHCDYGGSYDYDDGPPQCYDIDTTYYSKLFNETSQISSLESLSIFDTELSSRFFSEISGSQSFPMLKKLDLKNTIIIFDEENNDFCSEEPTEDDYHEYHVAYRERCNPIFFEYQTNYSSLLGFVYSAENLDYLRIYGNYFATDEIKEFIIENLTNTDVIF